MSYEVRLREVQTIKAMTKRYVTGMKNVEGDFGSGFTEVWEHIEKNGGTLTGECFALYHDENFDPDKMDVEIGFSVADFVPDGENIKGREIGGGLHASVVHKGPYSGLEPAYATLAKWVEENGYIPLIPMRDLYLNDPASVPPEEVLTEVLFPVKKK
jgi:effector-binding domain-containing protein